MIKTNESVIYGFDMSHTNLYGSWKLANGKKKTSPIVVFKTQFSKIDLPTVSMHMYLGPAFVYSDHGTRYTLIFNEYFEQKRTCACIISTRAFIQQQFFRESLYRLCGFSLRVLFGDERRKGFCWCNWKVGEKKQKEIRFRVTHSKRAYAHFTFSSHARHLRLSNVLTRVL